MSDVQKFGEEFQRVGKDNSFAVRGGTACPQKRTLYYLRELGIANFSGVCKGV